ncbi:MAG: MTH1187 family thiamine-binding protein [Gemmatimonadetes bacterium]|nr:MTH1187 family thiamine-binding protein [Gemmatimonadota bacterium]
MHLIADICVIPLGVGLSVSKHVAACERIFQEAGLTHRLHSYGTNVEGDWDDVMASIKRCHEVVHEMGAVRISTTVRLGTRNDREQTMQDKLDSVARELEE